MPEDRWLEVIVKNAVGAITLTTGTTHEEPSELAAKNPKQKWEVESQLLGET